ncbi:hypothetical protein D3C75_735100 [compost metagenome]
MQIRIFQGVGKKAVRSRLSQPFDRQPMLNTGFQLDLIAFREAQVKQASQKPERTRVALLRFFLNGYGRFGKHIVGCAFHQFVAIADVFLGECSAAFLGQTFCLGASQLHSAIQNRQSHTSTVGRLVFQNQYCGIDNQFDRPLLGIFKPGIAFFLIFFLPLCPCIIEITGQPIILCPIPQSPD